MNRYRDQLKQRTIALRPSAHFFFSGFAPADIDEGCNHAGDPIFSGAIGRDAHQKPSSLPLVDRDFTLIERNFTLDLKDAESAAVGQTDDGYAYVIMPLARDR